MHTKNLPRIIAIACTLFFFTVAKSQTIFTYGGTPVSKDEFLKAFNKNPDTTGDHAQKIREYLNLYINFKLKLREAYSEKLDAKDEFKDEARNFRSQLTENYINSQANIAGLVHEAFVRSQKDILLAEVFVAAPAGSDTAAPRKTIEAALAELNKGKSFEEVTEKYSTDEYIKSQKGQMGYITVFSLPYEIENLVYALKPGQNTGIYRSSIGYHIFEDAGERNAAGKRKIQQVLLPFGAGFNNEEKQVVGRKADSLYTIITNGGPFEEIAQKYSNPNTGGQQNGITSVGVGMYSPAFEEIVYNLKKVGDISKPFATEYGYNIVKLLEIIPVVSKENDVVNQSALQQLVEGGDRLALAKNNLVKQWLALTGYKKGSYDANALWIYTDSALAHSTKTANAIDSATVLFSFTAQKVTVKDWLNNIKLLKQAGTAIAAKKYPALLNDFTNQSCSAYYRSHIQEYNAAISSQMQEFNEANLLFAVMDEHVWGKASLDTTALLKYYTAHQKSYNWAPGVSALTVSSANKAIIDSVVAKIKANPALWRSIAKPYNNLLTADSSRYENGQLPVKQAVPMQAGFASTPEQNDGGDTWTFVYVFEAYPQQQPRSFEDAKGMVINDYQQVLENDWLEVLKKKYPVKVNEDVVKGLK